MDVHKFINNLRDEKLNQALVSKIQRSIITEKVLEDDNICLEVPGEPNEIKKKMQARCIHGHVFEDYTLKSALDDGRQTNVLGISDSVMSKQLKERRAEIKNIFGGNPKKKYFFAMEMAGSSAWTVLKYVCRAGTKSNAKLNVRFEEWIKNKKSDVLMGSLRADFVCRTDDSIIIVDLKFSTMRQKSYEDNYLIDGIIQVLIYALLMETDSLSIKLGVLVYYGTESKVVFYSTDELSDTTCMRQLMKKSGIQGVKLSQKSVVFATEHQVIDFEPRIQSQLHKISDRKTTKAQPAGRRKKRSPEFSDIEDESDNTPVDDTEFENHVQGRETLHRTRKQLKPIIHRNMYVGQEFSDSEDEATEIKMKFYNTEKMIHSLKKHLLVLIIAAFIILCLVWLPEF